MKPKKYRYKIVVNDSMQVTVERQNYDYPEGIWSPCCTIEPLDQDDLNAYAIFNTITVTFKSGLEARQYIQDEIRKYDYSKVEYDKWMADAQTRADEAVRQFKEHQAKLAEFKKNNMDGEVFE